MRQDKRLCDAAPIRRWPPIHIRIRKVAFNNRFAVHALHRFYYVPHHALVSLPSPPLPTFHTPIHHPSARHRYTLYLFLPNIATYPTPGHPNHAHRLRQNRRRRRLLYDYYHCPPIHGSAPVARASRTHTNACVCGRRPAPRRMAAKMAVPGLRPSPGWIFRLSR